MVTLKHGLDVWTGRCKIVKLLLKSGNIFLVSNGRAKHNICKITKIFLKWQFLKPTCLLISLKVLDGCLNTPYSVYRYKRQISQENPQNIERIWFGLVYLYRSLSIQFIPTKDSSAQSPPYNMEIKAKLSNTKHCII